MTVSEKICSALRTGEDNAVSLSDMCKVSGRDNRRTRLVIEDLRRHGTVICSSDKGYFYPANLPELRRYIRKEKSRSNSIDLTLKAAERLLYDWGGESI